MMIRQYISAASIRRAAGRLLLLLAAAWLFSTIAIWWHGRRQQSLWPELSDPGGGEGEGGGGGGRLQQLFNAAIGGSSRIWRRQQQQQQQQQQQPGVAFVQILGAGGGRLAALLQHAAAKQQLSIGRPLPALRRSGCRQRKRLLQQLIEQKEAAGNWLQLLMLLHPCPYNRELVRSVMAKRHYYHHQFIIVSTITWPLQQMLHMFQLLKLTYYNGNSENSATAKAMENFLLLLQNGQVKPDAPGVTPGSLHCSLTLREVTQNFMSRALGFSDGDSITAFTKSLLQDSNVILLMPEHIDESLILLKRRMKWTFKEVLFWPTKQQHLPLTNRKLQLLHEQYSPADYALFQAANTSLWQSVANEGASLFKELRVLRSLRRFVQRRCQQLLQQQQMAVGAAEVNFLANRFSPAFSIDYNDCVQLLQLHASSGSSSSRSSSIC